MKKKGREEESKKEVEAGDSVVPDYTTIVGLKRSGVADIVARIREISTLEKELKEERKDLALRGAKIFIKAGVKSVMVGELRVTRVDGASANISKTKLFELGVSERVIEKATTRSKYTTLKITEKGGEGDGEAEG